MTDCRRGRPDPLVYYLHAAALAHTQAISAAYAGKTDVVDDAVLLEMAQAANVLDVADASVARLGDMLSGIDMWRAHPYRRKVPELPVLWKTGQARLLDYGIDTSAPPVLVIPSLINQANILDLDAETSFLRRLANDGVRPILLDWGDTIPGQKAQSIADHLDQILLPAFAHVSAISEKRPALLGYCVGGTLAIGLAALQKDAVSCLGLIGAPWDFAELCGAAKSLRAHVLQTGPATWRSHLQAMGQSFGLVPSGVFQQLFAVVAPMQAVQKFSAFKHMPQDSAAARKFVGVEDWLSEGVGVPAPAAETILMDWYVHNQTGTGAWTHNNAPLLPEEITCPTLVVTGTRDHIVPSALSVPLLDALADAQHHSVDLGHVGMIISAQAHAQVANRLSSFFLR